VSVPPLPGVELSGFELLAEDAWLLRLGARIDPALNARVHRLAAAIRADAPAWLRDLVPAYASLGVFFDPGLCDAGAVRRQLAGFAAALADPDADDGAGRTTEIPVAYGGAHGPDLDDAARELGMSARALVERHAAGDYSVAMIGFAPGFPYLSGLDSALALPRLATPRTRVPAGIVASAWPTAREASDQPEKLSAYAGPPVRCGMHGSPRVGARRHGW